MKPTLQLKLNTGLTLTPQLQQSIRLLQLSTLELNQEITRLVQDGFETGGPDISLSPSDSSAATESNGISEIGKNTDIQSDWPDDPLYADQEFFFDTRRRSDEDHDQDFSRLISKPVSLREHLLSQISLGQYCERSKKIAELLVDSLNDDGYLSQDLDELAELLPPELEISTADLESALDYIQQLDPPGVGARNLQECLSLQLKALPGNTPLRDEALKLVNGHLESFAAKNFQLLKKVLDCNETCLQSIYQLITQLNPKPGDDFNTT